MIHGFKKYNYYKVKKIQVIKLASEKENREVKANINKIMILFK